MQGDPSKTRSTCIPMNDANTVETLTKLFERYEPLSNLNESNIVQVAKGASSFQLGKRQRLLAADEHRWLVYLVSGSVVGKGPQGDTFTIRPVNKGQTALFDGQPRPTEVTVSEDAQFIRVDRKQFSVMMNEQISSSTFVREIEFESSDVFEALIKSYNGGALQLPVRESVIELATKVLADPDPASDKVLLDFMRKDPSFALLVAQVAGQSRPKAGTLTSLESILELVDRSLLAQQLSQWSRDNPFPEKGTALHQRVLTAYDYLRRVGAFSREIAQSVGTREAGLAEFTGLCARVGSISMWLMLNDQVSEQEARTAAEQLCSLVTETLMAQMLVDDKIIEAVDAIANNERNWHARVGHDAREM